MTTSKPKPPALVSGPYSAPVVTPGDSLICKAKGRVNVAGLTDGAASTDVGPIAWPYHHAASSKRSLVLYGDLAKAVRIESARAVAYYWGVDRKKASEWRQTLGVGRMNAGTTAEWVRLAPQRLHKPKPKPKRAKA